MSMDSIDDLEAAEDLIGTLEQALREALKSTPDRLGEGGLAAMRAAITYCRPTCGAEGVAHDDPDSPTYQCERAGECGCPCHDRNPTTQGASS
jgi:hypothetical protein